MSSNRVIQVSVPSCRESWSGTVFIFLSTFFYGVSNATIRLLTGYEVDFDWILFYKELLGFLILLPWVIFRLFQGRFSRISRRLIIYVVIAAVICEFIGAHLQVLGYAVIGLVITVPLIQSSTLIGVALLGRYFFGEDISVRRWYAIGVLIVSVFALSVGKELTVQGGAGRGGLLFIIFVLGAVVAGVAYSVYVVLLRYTVRKYWDDNGGVWQSFQFTKWAGFDLPQRESMLNNASLNNGNLDSANLDSANLDNADLDNANLDRSSLGGVSGGVVCCYAPFPVTLMMLIILGVGVLIFGLCIFVKSGVVGFYDVPFGVWYIIPVAGLSNVVGFFCQIQGLKMTSAVQASLIGVSQMILLSVVGFIYFRESVNFVVVSGLILTAYGVIISAKPENTGK
jgi:drug/metabolite transporter (DMT)-like permease